MISLPAYVMDAVATISATNTMIAIAATISTRVNLFSRRRRFITDPVDNKFIQHFSLFPQLDDQLFQRELSFKIVELLRQPLSVLVIGDRLIPRIREELFRDSSRILVLQHEILRRLREHVHPGPAVDAPGDPFLRYHHQLKESGKPLPKLYIWCGTEDFLLENARETKAFFESLEGNPFDYQYEEMPGAHTWDFWDARIQDFLRYIHVK